MDNNVKNMIAKTFLEMAEVLETGAVLNNPKIVITGTSSEHPEEIFFDAAKIAAGKGVSPVVVARSDKADVKVASDEEAHEKMNEMLCKKEADGAVTMHYSFPIGVSTVGRVVTPGIGREMFIATTTGTSSTDRVYGMIRNAVYGIIAAKACGIENPSVGILNVDGARQVEKGLNILNDNGFPIHFASSKRAEGGVVMRGNDILIGACDVLVVDSLTGNILMKMFSAFQSGGNYETTGFGYGPGIGENFDKLIMIISRASGAPVAASAMIYAAELIRGGIFSIAKEEFKKANDAGLASIMDRVSPKKEEVNDKTEVKEPEKEIVTEEIMGIEILDLEDCVRLLWAEDIYAQSGMGCTGPVILVSEVKYHKAKEILTAKGFIM